MRLLLVELRRLVVRRAIRVAMLLGMATIGFFGYATYLDTVPMTEHQLAVAERRYQDALAGWEAHGAEILAECLERQAEANETSTEEVDLGCEGQAPQWEWYVVEPPDFDEYTSRDLPSTLPIPCVVGLLVGVTFVSAEFGAGSIVTWLTFVPRRRTAFGAKVGAAAVAGLAYGLLWGAALLAALVGPFLAAGLEASVDAALVLRIGVLGLVATALGAGLAFLVRRAAAALAIVLGYLVAVDWILLPWLPTGGRWTIGNNGTAWVMGSSTYDEKPCGFDPACELVERTISMAEGGLVLAGTAVVVVLAGYLSFRLRDV